MTILGILDLSKLSHLAVCRPLLEQYCYRNMNMQTVSSSHPDDSWRREFPRLAELRDNAPSTEPGTFFHSIPATVAANLLAHEVYQELESDLAVLDGDAWSAFKSKLLQCDLKRHGHRGYTGIHSVLYEAKGYRLLKQELSRMNLDHDQIVLIPETDQCKTPEWAAFWRGTPVGVLEVKTIYESDDQSKYVYENTRKILECGEATVRRGDPSIPGAFWRKLQSTVDRARDQLDYYAPEKNIPRIAFLIVHFDHDLTMEPANYAAVASFLDGLRNDKFQVAYQFRGLNAPT